MEDVRPGNTALLVMHVQNWVVDKHAAGDDELLDALGRATNAARLAGIPVIYVRIAFRPGSPEVNPRNRHFSRLVASFGFEPEDHGTQIHSSIAPQPGDIVVTNKRISAFAGSDLDMILRSLDVSALVLTGIATRGVVLSTARQALDLDYELTVLSDGCADPDPEAHRFMMAKVFVDTAVLETDAWISQLQLP